MIAALVSIINRLKAVQVEDLAKKIDVPVSSIGKIPQLTRTLLPKRITPITAKIMERRRSGSAKAPRILNGKHQTLPFCKRYQP